MTENLLEKLLELKQNINNDNIQTMLNVLIYLKMNEDRSEKYTEDVYLLNIENNQYFEIRNYNLNMIFYKDEKLSDRVPLFRYNPPKLKDDNHNFVEISNYYKEIIDNIIKLNINKEGIKKSILNIEKLSTLDDIIFYFVYGTSIEYHYIDLFDFETYVEEHHKDIQSISINDEIITRKEFLTDKFQKTEYDDSLESESYEFLKYLKEYKLNKYVL